MWLLSHCFVVGVPLICGSCAADMRLEHRYRLWCILQVSSRRICHCIVDSKLARFRDTDSVSWYESQREISAVCGVVLKLTAEDVTDSVVNFELLH